MTAIPKHEIASNLEKNLTLFGLPLLLLLANSAGNSATDSRSKDPQIHTGTLEKLIVESGSVTLGVDLRELNGRAQISWEAKPDLLANSF